MSDWMWRDQQVPSSSSMSAPSSNSNAQYPLHRAVTSYQSDTSGGGASASSNLRVQPSSAPISSASSSSSASPYYSLAQDASLQTLKQNALEHEVNTLRAELAFAQQASAAKDAKIEQLARQSAVLAKNISVLYRTATAESARKAREITDLRHALDKAQQQNQQQQQHRHQQKHQHPQQPQQHSQQGSKHSASAVTPR